MNYEALACDVLKALRGQRSQTAFSRRLGYRSNVVYSWESGRRFPTAAEGLRAAEVAGFDLKQAWRHFYQQPPAWFEHVDTTTTAGVAMVLTDLRGRQNMVELAQRAGVSRYSISRWLNGQTEPRLPDFLRLFDALSLRLLDWLAGLLDVTTLPAAQVRWQQLEAQRSAAQELPWTQAVLQALELAQYQQLAQHQTGWLAQRLGISVEHEQLCLSTLATAGQIHWQAEHWWPVQSLTVDTHSTPAAGQQMKAFWAQQGLQALQAGQPGQFSYNVFGVSEVDFQRLRKLHLAYFRQMRAIVADSQPTQRVAVVNVQLFALDGQDSPSATPAKL